MDLLSLIILILCSVILPIILWVVAVVKKRDNIKPLFLGIITFLIFQVFTRIPLIQTILPNVKIYKEYISSNIYIYAIFLGLTAALFEEIGRYIIIKLFMKDRNAIDNAIAFGIGHGGIEALLLVGINAVVMLVLYQGSLSTPFLTIAGGVERVFTMILHTSWSIMVFLSIKQKKKYLFFIALIMHFLIDSTIVILAHYDVSILIIEALIGIISIIMFVYIIKIRKRERISEL